MLRKISLGLIACVIASQAEALALYKATLISHNESTTGGIKAIYKNAPSVARLIKDSPTEPLFFGARVMSQQVIAGKPTSIQSDNRYYVYNNTDTTQEYVVNINTCVDNQSDTNNTLRCAITSDKFSIEPQGYVDENRMPELIMQFTDLKPQLLSSQIQISQWQSGKVVYFVNSEASGNIIVASTQGE